MVKSDKSTKKTIMENKKKRVRSIFNLTLI